MSKARLFSPARKEAGFTLIELLTVIVIIGILAAIAIPVFTSQRARAQDSQTISDVRNIAVQAETIMSDPTKTHDDVTKANIDFTSSKNVSWNISGKASLGGYCIVAKNTAGKKYTTDTTALTYDSLAGGVGRSGKACDATANPVVPSGSTAVGSAVAVAVAAPTNVSVNRNSQTSATVSWTIPTDTDVNGYLVQRAANNVDSEFATIGTITSRATATYTDTSAPSTAAYYRLISTTAAGTSSQKSTVATLGVFVPSTTINANNAGVYGSSQNYSITDTGVYRIEAYGAQGGTGTTDGVMGTGGKGAYASGTFSLNAGQSLTLFVGQSGSAISLPGAGGGGATGVNLGNNPLVVAGGGGGGVGNTPGAAGSVTLSPNTAGASSGSANNPGTAGVASNGYGGLGTCGSGGGGYFGSGGYSHYNYVGGMNWQNGGNAGTSPHSANGGFGWAGGGGGGGWGSGGGGGWTGGSGTCYPSSTLTSAGQGGGSYVASNSTTTGVFNNTDKAQSGQGKVVITRIS